jgi:hypothetical protein
MSSRTGPTAARAPFIMKLLFQLCIGQDAQVAVAWSTALDAFATGQLD